MIQFGSIFFRFEILCGAVLSAFEFYTGLGIVNSKLLGPVGGFQFSIWEKGVDIYLMLRIRSVLFFPRAVRERNKKLWGDNHATT